MEEEIIKKELMEMADVKYKEFHKNLCPTMKKEMIGVRIPTLRKYAKKLIVQNEQEKILNEIGNEYYEEIMLQGMIIGLSNEKDIKKIQEQIKKFIPKIDNWAVCDTFCAGLKITKKNKEEMWNFLQPYLKSDKEFYVRFGVVMLLDYYIEEEFLLQIFDIFNQIFETSRKEQYYVQMAVAWAIAEAFTKFYDQTKKYLKTSKIDVFTYNKSIQKAIESYRITKQQKEELKKLKKFEKSIS